MVYVFCGPRRNVRRPPVDALDVCVVEIPIAYMYYAPGVQIIA